MKKAGRSGSNFNQLKETSIDRDGEAGKIQTQSEADGEGDIVVGLVT